MFQTLLAVLGAFFSGVFWAAIMGMQPAHAQDHVTGRAWLEDSTGQMTLAQVQQQTIQPFQGVLNRGFGTGVLWLRLHIDPHIGPPALTGPAATLLGDALVLRIRPVYLDEVTVFDPLAAAGVAGTVGDRHHPRLDALLGTDFLLPIARGSAPRELWLRLSTISTRQIDVAVLPRNQSSVRTLWQTLGASLYIGVVLVLMVWGLASYGLQRESVMGAFALMQATSMLYGLSSLGILRALWPLAWSAELLDGLGSFFSLFVVLTGVWFHVQFLREFRPASWAMRLLCGVVGLSSVNLAVLFAGKTSWALQANMALVLVAAVVCVACALTIREREADGLTPSAAIHPRVLKAFYGLLLFVLLLASATGLGALQATEWTIYVSQLHGLLISILLMLMLQYRNHVHHQQRHQAVVMLETARLQVKHERLQREEQERLLLMLAHEIKTPLAIMHLRLDNQAKGAGEIRQAMRDMDAVIERCLQTVKAEGEELVPQLQMLDLAWLVREALAACQWPERVQVQQLSSLPLVTDAQLVLIVLSNLLENACKYSAPDSPISVFGVLQAGVQPPVCRLEVANQPGPAGWPDAAQVFDKYYRARLAQRQSGTGLGLYLAQNLVRALGGQLTYEPDGVQIRFVLFLPIAMGSGGDSASLICDK